MNKEQFTPGPPTEKQIDEYLLETYATISKGKRGWFIAGVNWMVPLFNKWCEDYHKLHGMIEIQHEPNKKNNKQ